MGVAVDGSGDLFIADTDNNVIREVNASTHVITTVAGNGTFGDRGDNGPATAAKLDDPPGVTVDGSGDLFIADTGNNRVREVNASTHVITTVAGNGTYGYGYSGDNGPATAAELDDPRGVTVDGSGDLFIADTATTAFARSTPPRTSSPPSPAMAPTATAATTAQPPPPYLNYPAGIAVDSSGDLFIADTGNNVIREVNASTRVITTVAGGGTTSMVATAVRPPPRYSTIPGDCRGRQRRPVHRRPATTVIREVNACTHVITTVAGNGTGGYAATTVRPPLRNSPIPAGVAVDGSGDLFIADTTTT